MFLQSPHGGNRRINRRDMQHGKEPALGAPLDSDDQHIGPVAFGL